MRKKPNFQKERIGFSLLMGLMGIKEKRKGEIIIGKEDY